MIWVLIFVAAVFAIIAFWAWQMRRTVKVSWRNGGLLGEMPEVTSAPCPACDDPDGDHAFDCPIRIAKVMMPLIDDSGEPMPAAMSAPPNIGGEDHPDYAGPHHDSAHGAQTRFVPYDMLDEPIPGTAVHKVGNTAIAGPLEDKGEY